MRNVILQGDALSVLKGLPDCSVQMCCTSPPYYALRNYEVAPSIWDGDEACYHEWGESLRAPWANNVPGPNGRQKNTEAGHWKTKETGPYCQVCGAWKGCLGLEPTPELFVQHLVQIFREVRRVLKSSGVLWVNIADSYAGSWGNYAPGGITGTQRERTEEGKRWEREAYSDTAFLPPSAKSASFGLKDKDLIGIPWMTAFALRADGWWLRSDCIWAKGNPMPESVQDRPTRSHEYVFLLSKSERYFYDNEAVKEPGQEWSGQAGTFARSNGKATHLTIPGQQAVSHRENRTDRVPSGRNKRSVWQVNTFAFPEAHFATFPPKLVEPMILSGSSPMACEHCGAPWERMTEREFVPQQDVRDPAKLAKASVKGLDRTNGWGATPRGTVNVTTAGWQPTCKCPNNTGIGKCIVLDCFMGAGTTALVALQHGRDYLGIELNSQYVAMSNRRISQVQQNLWTTEGVI